jgi:histidinol-phosphate aminotransferase
MQTPTRLLPVPALRGASAYTRPAELRPVDLRLDGNEGLAPSLPPVSTRGLNRYPDAGPLTERLAASWGLDKGRVLVTAGGDDAIDRVCRAVLAPGRSLVCPTPTFEMLTRYADLTGAEVRPVDWPDGPYPVDAVLAQVDETTACIAIVSPNNPTGAVASRDDLQRLADAAPGALLLVDLAYVELADDDPTDLLLSLPNAVAIRTFSKAWGLAGARVGYVLGPAEVLSWLRAVGQPYAVSRPSLAIAQACLDRGDEPVNVYVAQVRRERARLTTRLRALGATVADSQANFVLARFADAGWVCDALAGLGIAVRRWTDRPGLDDALRITCPGDEAAFARLDAALAATLAPEAILFDLDGVLADVSRSYRAAIVETAASYGVTVTAADVAAAKQSGDANDDWALTRRLLGERGVDAPLAEVTERFEGLYQGGLWTRETALVDVDWLRRLARRLPLAVVTGRPRGDAERFLAATGFGSCFSAVVCREDAPLKPSPAPVALALERLGVERAWMLGDTRDDIVAAKIAGVVPIGVHTEDADPLLRAGAARVLRSAKNLEELL